MKPTKKSLVGEIYRFGEQIGQTKKGSITDRMKDAGIEEKIPGLYAWIDKNIIFLCKKSLDFYDRDFLHIADAIIKQRELLSLDRFYEVSKKQYENELEYIKKLQEWQAVIAGCISREKMELVHQLPPGVKDDIKENIDALEAMQAYFNDQEEELGND